MFLNHRRSYHHDSDFPAGSSEGQELKIGWSMSMRIISPLIRFVGIAVAAALVLPASSSYSQYASSNNPKANQLYIVCSLVDDPHKTVYYSGIFRGLDPSIHIYEKSFSTHLEMSRTTVIGTAKCSSYQSEGAAKAGLAN